MNARMHRPVVQEHQLLHGGSYASAFTREPSSVGEKEGRLNTGLNQFYPNYASANLRRSCLLPPHGHHYESRDGMLYHVQFKRSHRYYGLHFGAPLNLVQGEMVIVEADRGEDIGVVRGAIPASEYREDRHTAGHRGRGFAVGEPKDNKKLLRRASPQEVAEIKSKVIEEELTLQVPR